MSTKKTCDKNTVSQIYNMSLNLYTSWWTIVFDHESVTLHPHLENDLKKIHIIMIMIHEYID